MLGLSSDQRQLESWGGELERLAGMVEDPGIAAPFASPHVSPIAKVEALATITEKLNLSFPVRSFAAVVARHGRIGDLPAIAEVYRTLLDELAGRARATLTFAQQPSDAELARVVAGLEAIAHKKILPTINLDGALLGGVVAELEGKIYDGSLATRLAQAQQRLAG